jgi:hypothetical protein
LDEEKIWQKKFFQVILLEKKSNWQNFKSPIP